MFCAELEDLVGLDRFTHSSLYERCRRALYMCSAQSHEAEECHSYILCLRDS